MKPLSAAGTRIAGDRIEDHEAGPGRARAAGPPTPDANTDRPRGSCWCGRAARRSTSSARPDNAERQQSARASTVFGEVGDATWREMQRVGEVVAAVDGRAQGAGHTEQQGQDGEGPALLPDTLVHADQRRAAEQAARHQRQAAEQLVVEEHERHPHQTAPPRRGSRTARRTAREVRHGRPMDRSPMASWYGCPRGHAEAAARGGAHVGSVGVNIILQTGVGLEDVTTFRKFLGGSPTNVAARPRAWPQQRPDHRHRRRPVRAVVHKALRELGVDDRFVTAVPELPTPVAFCELRLTTSRCGLRPPPEGAGPHDPRPRAGPRRDRRRRRLLGHHHRPVRGAQPQRPIVGAGGPGAAAASPCRPGLPPRVLAVAGGRTARAAAGAAAGHGGDRQPPARVRDRGRDPRAARRGQALLACGVEIAVVKQGRRASWP